MQRKCLPVLAMEYASFVHADQLPLGMVILPAQGSPLLWHGVWFVHRGYYAGAVFKFNVLFPERYPQEPPTVNFITPVFHPLVRVDGLLNVEAGFPQWRPSEHHIHNILFWLSDAFSNAGLDKISKDDSWNKEAFRLYHESRPSFTSLATQSVTLTKSNAVLESGGQPQLGNDAYNKGIALPPISAADQDEIRESLSLIDWDKSFE